MTFKEVNLEFDKGLVVLTGPSGAGKSVLISTILSSFGYSSQGVATLCELDLIKPLLLEDEGYVFEKEITLKTVKKEKLRYFIDGQKISKLKLKALFSPFIQYLSVRDKGGFDSVTLLEMIDKQLQNRDKDFKKLSKEYHNRYVIYREKFLALKKIEEDEAKLLERIEYAKYEVNKIASIDPKIGEDEALLKVKQQLSRIDKVKEALESANDIFGLEKSVQELYQL